jgi:hypothetical protein
MGGTGERRREPIERKSRKFLLAPFWHRSWTGTIVMTKGDKVYVNRG